YEVMEQQAGKRRVRTMLPLRPPRHCQRLSSAADKITVGLIEGTPSLIPCLHLKVEDLAQVMAKRSDEAGVLPPRAVPGAPKAIDTPVWLALHNNVALELLQRVETRLKRVPV